MKKRYLTKGDESELVKKFGTANEIAKALYMTKRMWLYIKSRDRSVSRRVQALINYNLGKSE